MQSEHVRSIASVDQMYDIVADVVRQLGEQCLGLLFGQRPHVERDLMAVRIVRVDKVF